MPTKSGRITANLANGTNDDLPNDVLSTPRMTLAEARKMIATSPEAVGRKKFVIDLQNREIHVFPNDAVGHAGGTVLAILTKDEPGATSSPLTNGAADIDAGDHPGLAAVQDALNSLIAARKPSVSGSSVINATENALTGEIPAEGVAELDENPTFVVIDQTGDGTVTVVSGGAINAAGREAHFAQDVTPAAAEETVPFES